jgi:hypothetical protein
MDVLVDQNLGCIAPHYGGFVPTRTTAGIDPLARHKEVWRDLEDPGGPRRQGALVGAPSQR